MAVWWAYADESLFLLLIRHHWADIFEELQQNYRQKKNPKTRQLILLDLWVDFLEEKKTAKHFINCVEVPYWTKS